MIAFQFTLPKAEPKLLPPPPPPPYLNIVIGPIVRGSDFWTTSTVDRPPKQNRLQFGMATKN
jgi:hypothetical protein